MSLACRDRRSRAFTLVELLTVMAIIAILVSIGIGAVRGASQRAAIARGKADLAALATALEEFKRHYGDYPQLAEFAQAAVVPTTLNTGPGLATVQARLFNCLTGAFGPARFGADDRLNGPNFLDVGKFSLDAAPGNTFQVPATNAPRPPFKPEQNVSLLDPWGHRYLYYYKNARSPNTWQAAGYVLYSAGPDGAHTAPPNTGILTATQLAAVNNADNLYANP